MQSTVAARFAILVLCLGLRAAGAQSAQSGLEVITPKGPILMARTPVAPFNAEGSATFLSGFGSSNGPAILSLQLRGFTPGHYLFGIVRASNGSFVPLAKFAIIDPTAGPDRDTTLNTKRPSSAQKAESLASQHTVSLTLLKDPSDIVQIVLADAYGSYLLMADLKPPRAAAATL